MIVAARWSILKLKDAVILLAFALLLSICLATGSPDEAYGRVVKVVDGDTFGVQLGYINAI
jgi:hypothetical protein